MHDLWKPACNLEKIHQRADMLQAIRSFFQQKSVLEVETPLLCQSTGTDPQLDFFSSTYHYPPNNKTMYLQTSPEFAMKRLLASGSGSIFQICKAFRNGESGQIHNPEFSILEWYRVGFSLHQLIDEAVELIVRVLNKQQVKNNFTKISYTQLFEQTTQLNPLEFCQKKYALYAKNNAIEEAILLCEHDHSLWLDYIFSFKVQPILINQPICVIYDYPAIQSSLARISLETPATADRFEIFMSGIEIGNGFFELADAKEQDQRFNQEIKSRQEKNLASVNKDKLFLDALHHGLPDCSGIAIGLDRLLMISTKTQSLNEVISFPFDRA